MAVVAVVAAGVVVAARVEVVCTKRSGIIESTYPINSAPKWPQLPQNAPSKNWKTGFLPHDSKNRRSFNFFPNKPAALNWHLTVAKKKPYKYFFCLQLIYNLTNLSEIFTEVSSNYHQLPLKKSMKWPK